MMSLISRCIAIVLIAAKHGLQAGVAISDPRIRTRARLKVNLGTILARALEELGPTFIKIGQILSSRPDVLAPGVAEALSWLRDRVKPMSQTDLDRALKDAFPGGMTAFEFFEAVPVRSASIAQVHRARLSSGVEVAVKIRRRGLAKKFGTDLRILGAAAAFIEKLPRMRSAPLRETVEEFGKTLQMQVDFRKEAESNRTFRRNLAETGEVVIPFLVDELCCDSAIVMQYIEGGRNVFATGFSPDEDRLAATKLLRVLYRMVFVDGFIHADMHPGNVFFLDDLRVLLLDFGMVAELNDEDLNHFTEFFLAMVSNDGRRCADIIRKTASWMDPRVPKERFDRMMRDIVAKHWLELARDYEVAQFGVEMFEAQRKCRIRGSTKFAMVILSFIVFEGIARALHPELDFQAEARTFIPMVLARRKQKGMLLNVV